MWLVVQNGYDAMISYNVAACKLISSTWTWWSGPEDTNQNEMNELALDNDHYGNDDDDDDDDDDDNDDDG